MLRPEHNSAARAKGRGRPATGWRWIFHVNPGGTRNILLTPGELSDLERVSIVEMYFHIEHDAFMKLKNVVIFVPCRYVRQSCDFCLLILTYWPWLHRDTTARDPEPSRAWGTERSPSPALLLDRDLPRCRRCCTLPETGPDPTLQSIYSPTGRPPVTKDPASRSSPIETQPFQCSECPCDHDPD